MALDIQKRLLPLPLSPTEERLFALVAQCGATLNSPVYVVGGFVRDKILTRESKDIDIVTIGSGIELAKSIASKLPNASLATYDNFGTAVVKNDEYEIEFVGARKESYRKDSRKPIVEDGILDDDLSRRDFTINALAISLNKDDYGMVLDAFDGLKHLEEKIIKTPLDPNVTFSDDPLRMMRGIRFASQLGFNIESHTFISLAQNRDRIKIISQERITDELNKIVLSPLPSLGFDLLFKSGLLQLIFPEMVLLHGVETLEGKGHKDNFYHTLKVLDNTAEKSNDLWLRWAAILHDIAKPNTKKFEEGTGWTFHGHEVVGARMVKRIFRRLKLPLNEHEKFVEKMVLLHLRPIALTKEEITDSALRRLLFDAGEDLESLMILCNADITSKNKVKVQRHLDNFEIVKGKLKDVEARDRIRNWQPPVDGTLIMETFGLGEGRHVGIIKTAIREAILDGIITNDYEAAFAYMLEKGKELGLEAVKKI